MNEFIVIFKFDDQDDHWGLQSCLDDHKQIKNWMKKNKAIQLTPNAFLVRTEENANQTLGHFTAYMDRSEDVFVISTDTNRDWSAVSIPKSLAALQKFSDEPEETEDSVVVIEHEEIS